MLIFSRHRQAMLRWLWTGLTAVALSCPVQASDCVEAKSLADRYSASIYRLDGKVAGTLVRPAGGECKVLKIFFPGQAQELGIFNSRVPEERREEWGRVLLEGPAYKLAPTLVKAGCPVLLLGESRLSLTPSVLLGLMAETGAAELELISHSAGYLGLTSQLRSLQGNELVGRIRALKLLDNYYDTSELPAAIQAALGGAGAARICTGFYTAHNAARYRSAYQSLCPASGVRGDHKAPVKEFFE